MLVSGVGSFVDWRKEVAFLAVKLKQMEKNVVSTTHEIKPAYFILLKVCGTKKRTT
jgi:hypothetical protein